MANSFLLAFIFYLIGSIPFALIIPKLFGLDDIRNIGSGNVGATNVFRTGNKLLAGIVLMLDILKGYLPILILVIFEIENNLFQIIFIGHFAVIGHIFPLWLKFKGGKGVATYIGFLFGINIIFGLIFIISWIIIAFIKKYSSLSSITSLIILPIYIFFSNYDLLIVLFFIYLSILIIFNHSPNIRRLLNKSESQIKL